LPFKTPYSIFFSLPLKKGKGKVLGGKFANQFLAFSFLESSKVIAKIADIDLDVGPGIMAMP